MNCRLLRTAALVSVLPGALFAQQDRIASAIDPLRAVRLNGSVHPSALPQFDAGAIDPSSTLSSLTLMLRPSDAQQADLDHLLAEQQDPSSPGYHNWLSPEQFADRFGAGLHDIGEMLAWLQAEGLTVEGVSRARSWIRFSGRADRVQSALRTEIRRYEVDGESHFANATEPSIPMALQPLVVSILGLDDFRPISALGFKRPLYTSGTTHYLAPDDFATIYNLNPLYDAGYDGFGQSIVVAGQSAIDLTDIQIFRSNLRLPKNDPQLILVPGSGDPGKNDAEAEADLDVEWAGATARKANIIYVYSTNVLNSVIYAVDQNLAPIITYSFGACEPQLSQNYMRSVQLWPSRRMRKVSRGSPRRAIPVRPLAIGLSAAPVPRPLTD